MSHFIPGNAFNAASTGSVNIHSGFLKKGSFGTLAWMQLAACLMASVPVFAAEAPDLGAAFDFAVLGANGAPTSSTVTCTNTGPGSTIEGNVGSTFTSITNTGCNITGVVDTPVDAQVVTDFQNAYSEVDSLNPTCDGVVPTTSTTLPPGVYCSAAGTTIGTGVTITLDGSATDVWVFRIGTGGLGALTSDGANFVMGGSADACNVYWRTAEGATLTDSIFKGTILSGAAFTMTRGSFEGRGFATTDATVTDAGPLQFAGCLAPASITVEKDFSDDNTDPVSVDLTCTSGTVDETPLDASEAQAAVFTVGTAAPGTTCTASEIVPKGYTANQSDCIDVPLGESCTIVNSLIIPPGPETVTVFKDFSDDNTGTVPVGLSCTSGTVDVTPLSAAQGSPAVFGVSGADPGATCTATETVPEGYTADQTECVGVSVGGSCTIFNTLIGPPPTAVPALSGIFLILLAGLLALLGFAIIRQQAR